MRIKRFTESNLTLGELDKTTKGQKRGQILVKKLQDEEELTFKPKGSETQNAEVLNSQEIIDNITTDDEYDRDKAKQFFTPKSNRYAKVIETEDDEYGLNDVEKTEDFGSSGGSSLGTKDTRKIESIQCIFLALRQSKGSSISQTDYEGLFEANGSIKSEYMNKVRIPDSSIFNKELIDKYSNWMTTFINTSNAMYEHRPVFSTRDDNKVYVLSASRTYIFYQIGYAGGLVEAINQKYREKIPIEGKKIPIAKWTPADIWCINERLHDYIIDVIKRCRSLDRLKIIIDRQFANKNLRGISLKKLKNAADEIRIVINGETPKPIYHYLRSQFKLNTIGVNVLVRREELFETSEDEKTLVETMNFRSFSGPDKLSDISGEIIGSSARHGKIGLTIINKILDKNQIPTIPTRLELFLDDAEMVKQRLINEINQMNETYGDTPEDTFEDTGSVSRVLSKWQSLKLLETLELNRQLTDSIMQEMFYFAMAISNDIFECPYYVRII
jgi:hypothetical protein